MTDDLVDDFYRPLALAPCRALSLQADLPTSCAPAHPGRSCRGWGRLHGADGLSHSETYPPSAS
jgi:hypothetical protein